MLVIGLVIGLAIDCCADRRAGGSCRPKAPPRDDRSLGAVPPDET